MSEEITDLTPSEIDVLDTLDPDQGLLDGSTLLPEELTDLQDTRAADDGALGPEILAEERSPSAWEHSASLFGLEQVHAIEITLDEDAILGLDDAPYASVLGGVALDGEALEEVGIRLWGSLGSFRDLDHNAGFAFSFDHTHKGHQLGGIDTLILRSLTNDPSLVGELLAYHLFRAMQIPAPRVGYASVSVNGRLYGLYLVLEPPDTQHFLEHWFDGATTGALFGGLNDNDLFVDAVPKLAATGGWHGSSVPLYQLVQALDWIDVDGDVPAQLDTILNLERYLAFAATEIAVGHESGYAWSRDVFYLYHASEGAPWSFIPWGIRRAFKSHLEPFGGEARLQKLCLGSPPCRDLLGATYDEIIATIAALDLAAIAEQAHALVAEAVLNDPRPQITPDAVSQALDEVLTYLEERPTTLTEGMVCLDPNYGDEDEDGVSSCFGADCDDTDPAIFPGALEVCNFADDDCDGEIDETEEGEEACPTCETIYANANGTVILCRVVANYADAHAACLSRGADLLSIHSQEEQEAIAEAAYADYSGHLWIGINDREVEGTFAWTDGSPVDYENWNDNEPNDWGSGEDCGHLYEGNGNKWNDLPCGHEAGYLCRIPELSLP